MGLRGFIPLSIPSYEVIYISLDIKIESANFKPAVAMVQCILKPDLDQELDKCS